MDKNIYRIKELIKLLNKYTKSYDEGHPEISDLEWDNLYFELKSLEEQTGIIYPNSPTQKIHFETISALSKTKHEYKPMLSLDKTKEVKDIQDFVKGHEWMAMFKLDGLSCRLTYNEGNLIKAETRGNGIEGEDITHNAFVIPSIPKTIPIKEEIIVDGEILCRWNDFNMGLSDQYTHPRALASGSIRLLSSKEAASRNLTFVAWDLIKGCSNIDFFFWRLEKLDDWGFYTVPRVGDAETVEDAISILDSMKNDEIYCEFPIDGYVFRFESQKYYESLGNTDHHFRGAIAYKFYDEEYETELLNIEWSMGRTGVLTPIAIFKPIEIDGTIVERASLHNVSIMREVLGNYPDLYEKIWVYKANMIIPQISRAEKNNVPHDHCLPSGIVTHCPYCGMEVTIEESDSGVLNAVCVNPLCDGKLVNRLDHFLGKKGLDVKGISKMTLEKLIDWGWINGLKDVYKLNEHRTEWISKPGFGEASVGKILLSIDASRSGTQLENFISAIGIPLVGRTIAKEIIKYYTTWEDFRAAVGGDWTEFEGFGPEISRSINNFDYTEADEIAGMLAFKQPEVQSEVSQATAIKDKKFCVTGKVTYFKNRDTLKADIELNGGKLVGSVTSATDYLITNTPDSGTAKNKDAQRLGVKIITEEEYLKMKS